MSLTFKLNGNIKGLIFDLDGVIADTAHLHYKAWSKIGKRWGFHLSTDQNEQLKGVSRADAMQKIAHWAGKNIPQKELDYYAHEKNTYYLDYCEILGPKDILPGILNLIQRSQRAGLKLAVGSASKNAKLILEKLRIINLFQTVVDGNMVENSKPHPEVFLKAAESIKINPEHCVVFEDSQAGIQAALNAKMYAIGVGASELFNCHSQIQTFEQFNLLELLYQLNN